MSANRGKTICFIDNANIFHGQQDVGWRIDWENFARYLNREGEIWQTYFFASEHNPPLPAESSFYQFLKGLGLRVEVVAWRHAISSDLAMESSSPVLYLDDLEQELVRK